MGLTIFYSGRLRSMQQLPHLITETTDICDQLHWTHALYDPTAMVPLRGMWFAPPGCDQIWMTFLPNGRLADPFIFERGSFPDSANKLRHEDFTVNSITQFAGPEVHMDLIRLLRHLSKKYFQFFRLVDESEYWESGNAEKCRDWFVMFGVWMDQMSSDLGKLDGRGYEKGETVQQRIEELMHERSWAEILNTFTTPMEWPWWMKKENEKKM